MASHRLQDAMLRLASTALAIAVCAVPRLSAQSSADRAALTAWRDSVASISSLAALQPFEPKGARGTVGLTRQAIFEFREAQLQKDRGPFDNTLMTLDRALQADDKSVYAWYMMGLVRKEMWDRKFTSKSTARHAAGQSYRRAAIEAYTQAIKRDSTFLPPSEALARLVNAMGHRILPPELLPPLRAAAQVPGVSPEVQLAISRLEFHARRYDLTLDAIGAYLRQGGDSGLGYLEQARTLYALNRTDESVQAYLVGVSKGDSVGRAGFRADLSFIAFEAEMEQFDSLPQAQVGEWITRFFRDRDALALRAPNERLREHLRRWVFVHRNFLIDRPEDAPIHDEGLSDIDQASLFDSDVVDDVMTELSFGVPRFTTYVRTQWEIDDRGVIYLRHGEPAKKINSVAGPPNESWSFYLPEGLRVFHFLGSRALGTLAGTTLVAALPMNADLLDARSDISASYAGMAAQLRNASLAQETIRGRNRGLFRTQGDGDPKSETQAMSTVNSRISAHSLQREVSKNRKAIAAAVSTDGFPLTFRKSLEAVVQVYGVGFGAGEARRVLAVFAVPGRMITPQARPDGGPGLLYPINVRLVAMDRAKGITRQLDTTRVFLTRDTLRGDQHLSGTLELLVPPGMYDVRALVTSPGLDAGASAGRDSISIPASPKALQLSDLILGRDGGITWSFTGQKVALNPLNAYPKGINANLFYEAGGLVPGTTYETTVAVRKPDDKPTTKPQVEVTTSFEARADYQQVSQGVGLAQLKPGNYWLIVTIRPKGGDGEGVTRKQALNILDK